MPFNPNFMSSAIGLWLQCFPQCGLPVSVSLQTIPLSKTLRTLFLPGILMPNPHESPFSPQIYDANML
jgi:hypothetical protein